MEQGKGRLQKGRWNANSWLAGFQPPMHTVLVGLAESLVGSLALLTCNRIIGSTATA